MIPISYRRWWGFESLFISHRLLLDLVRGTTMPLRCFLIRCDICLRRQAHILFLYIILMFLHNYCSSSVKIGCTIRICSSTVECRSGIILRQERPTRPRSTKNESCEYNFVLNIFWLTLLARRWSNYYLFRFIFSFVRSVREYRAP